MIYHIFSFCLFALLMTGCSTAIKSRSYTMENYHCGYIEQAEEILDATIEKEMPTGDYRSSKDAVWLLLDRATIGFASGEEEGAIADYKQAVEAIDFYSQTNIAESLAKIALQDECGAYPGDDFEQCLARIYFALALLHHGDKSNAQALLRQAEEFQQWKREEYHKSQVTENFTVTDNAVGKYLFGAILEKRGDLSNAEILYRDAVSLNPCIPYPSLDRKKATVLFLCHNGNAPCKVSGTSTASVASALALEIILGCNGVDPAISSMTGIPIPVLGYWPYSEPIPTYATIAQTRKPLTTAFDVNAIAHSELDQKMPLIVARGVARFVIRRGAVGYANSQDPMLGAVVDIGMLIANANTKADTRSWSTLPYTIDLARFDLDPGVYPFAIDILQNWFQKEIALQEGDLCVINIFNIHPGVTRVLIPKRFQAQQGETL
jgi:tetratricopeptide (TPR) repeat protein